MQQPEDLRTTLFVSQSEALQGSTRIVTLPGNRRMSFSVPAGVRDGEQVRLKGEGLSSPDGGPPGDLVITIMYRQTREIPAIKQPGQQSSLEPHSLEEIPTGPLGNRYPMPSPKANIEEMPTDPNSSNSVPLPFSQVDVEEIPTNPDASPSVPLPGASSIGDLPPFPPEGWSVPSPGTKGIPNGAPFPPQGWNVSPPGSQEVGDKTLFPPPDSKFSPLSVNAPLPSPGGAAPWFGTQFPPAAPSPRYPRRHSPLEQLRSPLGLLLIVLLLLIIAGSATVLFMTVLHNRSTGDASATSTASSATRTAQTTTAFPFSNTVLLSDALMDNSKGNHWEEDGDSNGSCSFAGGAYHAISALQNRFHACISLNFHASNFSYEVHMQIVRGDCGGMLFRRNGSRFYYFRVCIDGSYAFIRYASDGNTALNVTLKSSTTSAIHQGLNQINVLAVVASGSKIDLYVNHQLIISLQDSSYTQGQIGLVAKSRANATEAVFSNVMVWQLK